MKQTFRFFAQQIAHAETGFGGGKALKRWESN
jgi:hypothetical protein